MRLLGRFFYGFNQSTTNLGGKKKKDIGQFLDSVRNRNVSHSLVDKEGIGIEENCSGVERGSDSERGD